MKRTNSWQLRQQSRRRRQRALYSTATWFLSTVAIILVTWNAVKLHHSRNLETNTVLVDPHELEKTNFASPQPTADDHTHNISQDQSKKMFTEPTTLPIVSNSFRPAQDRECHNALNASSQGANLKRLDLPNNLLLHIGKAGGGTLQSRWRFIYGINPPQSCHPLPCPSVFRLSTAKMHTRNPNSRKQHLPPLVTLKSILITIRDPIDRFVSAVNWRLTELCDPRGDNRTVHQQPWDSPDERCNLQSLLSSPKERQVLFFKYQGNVSLLAEALCTEEGKKDRMLILHTNSIQEWLTRTTWETSRNKLLPVVQERGFDFHDQLDQAIEWVQQQQQLESTADFAMRKKEAKKRDCVLSEAATASKDLPVGQIPEATSMLQNLATARHTSSGQKHRFTKRLSARGEFCAAKYYSEDYKLLQELKDKACKFESCGLALQSILDRRKELLSMLEFETSATGA